MNSEPIVKEIELNVSAPAVWSAITDKNEMKKWYFDLEEFKAEKGFEFRFYGGDEKQWLHICKVTEVIINKKLSYSWRYDNIPGNTLVTFEISDEGDKCRVKLTHSGLENFPDTPELARENFDKGWEEIIKTSLKKYLEK